MEEIEKCISYSDSWNICALCVDQDCESYGKETFFGVSWEKDFSCLDGETHFCLFLINEDFWNLF